MTITTPRLQRAVNRAAKEMLRMRMAKIGAIGGAKSKRTLTREQSLAMIAAKVRANARKKKC